MTENNHEISNKESDQSRDRPVIPRADTNIKTIYASVAQVKATREEVMLLFGTRQPGHAEQNEVRVQLNERIVLNPIAAKRLALQLNSGIKEYESKFGLLDGKDLPLGRLEPTPPLSPPSFRSAKANEIVDLLFNFLNNQNLNVAFERSFKISYTKLFAKRFLLGFEKNAIRHDPSKKILEICEQMGMPPDFLKSFQRNLPEANIIGFGFGENETTCIIKAYLEFGIRFYKAIKSKPYDPAPYLSHLGFKWDAADKTKSALTKYTCFPAITVPDILETLSDSIYGYDSRGSLEIVKAILELASSKVGNDKFLYLVVSEENNPRNSFDINMYGANLQMNELYPYLLELCGHYSIPNDQFDDLYDPVKKWLFGHIAGGIDRHGNDFLTIYVGDKKEE